MTRVRVALPADAALHPGLGLRWTGTRPTWRTRTTVGSPQLGLGVADDNPDAARLYLRPGYLETGIRSVDRWSWTGPDGTRHEVADPVRRLVRALT
jgi:hypothetical protein